MLGIALIAGLIGAIAVPNLLNAIQRGKRKRTLGDIRRVATAVESYAVDHGSYPVLTPETDGESPSTVLPDEEEVEDVPTTDFGHDVVFERGSFTVMPEGQ